MSVTILSLFWPVISLLIPISNVISYFNNKKKENKMRNRIHLSKNVGNLGV